MSTFVIILTVVKVESMKFATSNKTAASLRHKTR